MKIHTGDTVVVISGKDKGKQGTVMRVLDEQNRLVVEGINMRIRHIKKTQNEAGQRVSYEASIHASNVMILDPKTKKPTRIGYKVDEKTGKKTRIALLSGEVIAKAATTKAVKGTKKTAAKDAKTEKAEDKKADKAEAPKAPVKQPFWKRGARDQSAEGGGAKENVDTNVIQTAHRSQGG